MKMYTIDGVEVSVVKKIEEGYLAKMVYHYNGYIEEDEDEIGEICDQINFYEKLYEKPPIEKYAKEVNSLIAEREELESKISALKKLKSDEEFLLNKINKFPILKKLADYLTGDFKLYMDFDRYEIVTKDRAYLPNNVKVVNFTKKGWCLYKLRSEDSDSYDDTPFMIFNTTEEAVEFSRDLIIAKMEQYRKNDYWDSRGLKEVFDKISYTNPVKKDEKLIEVYNSVFLFVTEREKKRAADKLREEIEAFEKKKKQLEQLG